MILFSRLQNKAIQVFWLEENKGYLKQQIVKVDILLGYEGQNYILIIYFHLKKVSSFERGGGGESALH